MLPTKSNLIERIDAIRKEINEISNGMSRFQDWAKSKYGQSQGLTNSSLSNTRTFLDRELTDGYPDYEGHIKKSLKRIDQFERAKNEFLAFVTENDYYRDWARNEHAQRFCNQIWYGYFFYLSRTVTDPHLARVVLKINEYGDVFLKNLPDDTSTDYEGQFSLVNDDAIFFDLKADRKDARLHIKVSVREKPKEISLGAYISFQEGYIITGSIVLQLLEEVEMDKAISTILSYKQNKKDFDAIPFPIRKYLSHKSINYSKIPNNIHSINGLNSHIKNYEQTQNRQTLFFDEECPILFISSPTNSIDEERHRANRQSILNLMERVNEEFPNLKIEYSGRERLEIPNNAAFKRNIQLLRRTKFFVLLYTGTDTASATLVELGLALGVCQSVIIYYKEDTFPKHIEFLSKGHGHVSTYPILGIQKSLNLICETLISEIKNKL